MNDEYGGDSFWLSEIAHMTTRPYVSDLSQPRFSMMVANYRELVFEDQVHYLLALGADSATATLRSRVAIMIDGNRMVGQILENPGARIISSSM